MSDQDFQSTAVPESPPKPLLYTLQLLACQGFKQREPTKAGFLAIHIGPDEFPKDMSIDEAHGAFLTQAINLHQTLIDGLPGGTLDALLRLMLERRASQLAVHDWDSHEETSQKKVSELEISVSAGEATRAWRALEIMKTILLSTNACVEVAAEAVALADDLEMQLRLPSRFTKEQTDS